MIKVLINIALGEAETKATVTNENQQAREARMRVPKFGF
jgi:hypothetical protein